MAAVCVEPYDKFGAPSLVGEEVSTGTSIMACVYDGGVLIGADSRTSTGVFIANRVSDKLTKITDHIFACRSGSASDTQAISDIVKYHLAFQKAETGEEPTVATAAAVFQELCYTHRDQLTAGIIVAGVDKVKGGQVFSIPIGGMRIEQKLAMGGSGSTYVYGFVDANFRENMPLEEAKAFLLKTLALCITRDGSSGGVIRIGTIHNDGRYDLDIYSGENIPKIKPF